MMDAFIPAELAVAPNALGAVLNLKLTTIPIDSHTCFELWMPNSDAILLAEEAMLLMSDRLRLEEICAKLTWLLGASVQELELSSHLAYMHDWQVIETYLQESGITFDAIGVTHVPQAICPNDSPSGISIAWTLRPTSWQVVFLALRPVQGGYQVDVQPIRLAITTGQPVTRLVQSVAPSYS